MAKLNFKKGLKANLANAAINPGTLYITTDEKLMYFDISETERIRIGNLVRVETEEALSNTPGFENVLYYITSGESKGGLFIYDAADGGYVLINGGGSGSSSEGGTYDDLNGRLTSAEINIKANKKDIEDEIARSTAAEADILEQLNTKLAAADAMRFKGVWHTSDDIPVSDVERGDTYKIGTAFFLDGVDYHVGDLVIAENDSEEDGSYYGGWSHVPSGYEDDYDATLAVDNQSIVLKNGVNEDRGSIVFNTGYSDAEGGLKVTVDSTSGLRGENATVNIEMMWGNF